MMVIRTSPLASILQDVLEFLLQAYQVEVRINAKREQIESLNELSKSASRTKYEMSAVHNADFHSDIEKIDELQENIVKDMLELVGAKEQIMEVIGKVENKEMLALLELRFLCYESGEEIADLLGYSVDNVF